MDNQFLLEQLDQILEAVSKIGEELRKERAEIEARMGNAPQEERRVPGLPR